MKSKDWLNRQKRDHFVKKAKKKGYLSRAAFKLVEIENKYKVIEKSKYVLEFGASPGGWSQVVLEVNPRIKITALDVLDFKLNHPNVFFHKEDYLNFNYDKLKKNFDLILSDIAPNTTGHQSTDHLRISNMIFDIIKILDKILAKNGVFICKIWKGSEEKELIKTLKSKFNTVSYFKPESSRKDSSEIFIVAINFLI
ncbi:MAG: RlmE family RNA methyltransferase [Pelagibacteraceae bacterium]|jgi:23S rRNA (uridine2552-2'-O)-methyltransferase|nr:RlmE family RNA methyltransferase [Pelagibacteraceae bacterium]MBT3901285.1 RlmE family RNA methyltransferase [Pelagibacteraceae bacterium]MBT4646300.1 RlmE family RNA methyltransferase [Pelagibacteraceae bacterium]MBT4951797.1 RlmE family RNA methyltransferase [Pelagibacteraceae bacterium]MBT6353573.1 RlmE family RNA methyltransferase [Pelagibacteraceae bacterium]